MAEKFSNLNILAIMMENSKDKIVLGFIEKSIVDIARKCYVSNTFVIEIFKEYADNINS